MNELDHWIRSPLTQPCLILGPIGSGKTTLLKAILDKYSDKFHEINLACPEQLISPVTYLEKRILMKDVTQCMRDATKPIYTLDSLDTMLAGEKTLISDLIKLFKSTPAIINRKIILIASNMIDKKLTELKKFTRTIEIEVNPNKEGTHGTHGTQDTQETPFTNVDSFAYSFQHALKKPSITSLFSFLSSDPWLAPLAAVDDICKDLEKKRAYQVPFLKHLIQWGKIMSQSNDDFFHEDISMIATQYMSHLILWFLKECVNVSFKKQASFTHLLTLHSVRKRTWNEKYDSGLPWMADTRCRLGSKFSANTVDVIWEIKSQVP